MRDTGKPFDIYGLSASPYITLDEDVLHRTKIRLSRFVEYEYEADCKSTYSRIFY